MQMSRKILPALITSAVLASALMAGPAFADDTTRTSGAITAASIVSDAATKPESGQKPIPDNILAGSQDALKDAYISAVSPHYLAKKLAAAAANGSSLAKEGNAEFYRDAVAVLSKERPGWEMMIPSKALKLSNTEADKFEMAAATAVATRYTQLSGDSSVTVTGPKVETREAKDTPEAADTESPTSDDGETEAETSTASGTPYFVSERPSPPAGTPEQKAALAKLPHAEWVGVTGDEWGDINFAAKAAKEQPGSMPIMVVYAIPGRDNGGASSGGAGSDGAYRAYIDKVAAAVGKNPVTIVLEPDALPHQLDNQGRLDMLGYAVKTFKKNDKAVVYVDAAHAKWGIAPERLGKGLEKIERAAGTKADGVSVNVSNFQTTEDSEKFGTAIGDSINRKDLKVLVDVSRNGAGAKDSRWCNPTWARAGNMPDVDYDPESRVEHAFIKDLTSSDGDRADQNCTQGWAKTPPAGSPFPEFLKSLLSGWKPAPAKPASLPAPRKPATAVTASSNDKCVVALDPGHNGAETAELDPKTKVLMKDYPNGREDEDAMAVANKVKEQLSGAGYTVVLLKEKVTDNVTYRARVTKAEDAGAKIAVSIHTTPGDASEVYEQVLGGWRSPEGQPDQAVKFTNEKTAAASHEFAQKFSTTRAEVEGHAVPITQNDFTPRPGLWDGNLPVISLLSENVPWVYNEYAGGASGGGANGISPEQIDSYANGLTKSIKNAVKCEKRDVADTPGKTKASATETPKPSDTTEPAEPTTSTEPTTPVMR